MSNQEPMFKKGQRLEVTDNTGKPYNTIQTLTIMNLVDNDSTFGPEYLVWIDNPDEDDEPLMPEFSVHESFWSLDKAVEEKRIFVKVLEG